MSSDTLPKLKLAVDLPKYGLSKGTVGIVVASFPISETVRVRFAGVALMLRAEQLEAVE